MPTKVLTIEELDRRRVAALGEYLRKYAPDNRRRQVFTGPKGVTDNSAKYHAEMATLDDAALTIRRKLQQARQDRQNWSGSGMAVPMRQKNLVKFPVWRLGRAAHANELAATLRSSKPSGTNKHASNGAHPIAFFLRVRHGEIGTIGSLRQWCKHQPCAGPVYCSSGALRRHERHRVAALQQ
jgi:hypothetical protein